MISQTARFPLPAAEFAFAGFSWPRRVATLPTGTTARRLERYKNPCTGGYYHAPRPVVGAHPGKGFYLESDGMPGLRWAWCDEVEGARIEHTGWFTDEFGDSDTMRGVVWRLPHGRGFLAGWSMGEGMATSLDAYVYATEAGAAHGANGLAETAADGEREYQRTLMVEGDDSPRDRIDVLHEQLRGFHERLADDDSDFDAWVAGVAADDSAASNSAAVEYLALSAAE